jgi:hypothetical protein
LDTESNKVLLAMLTTDFAPSAASHPPNSFQVSSCRLNPVFINYN